MPCEVRGRVSTRTSRSRTNRETTRARAERRLNPCGSPNAAHDVVEVNVVSLEPDDEGRGQRAVVLGSMKELDAADGRQLVQVGTCRNRGFVRRACRLERAGLSKGSDGTRVPLLVEAREGQKLPPAIDEQRVHRPLGSLVEGCVVGEREAVTFEQRDKRASGLARTRSRGPEGVENGANFGVGAATMEKLVTRRRAGALVGQCR